MLKIIVIAYLFLAGHTFANEPPIGHVKSVSGEASITTGDKKIKAEIGSPIYQGSVPQTGKKAAWASSSRMRQ